MAGRNYMLVWTSHDIDDPEINQYVPDQRDHAAVLTELGVIVLSPATRHRTSRSPVPRGARRMSRHATETVAALSLISDDDPAPGGPATAASYNFVSEVLRSRTGLFNGECVTDGCTTTGAMGMSLWDASASNDRFRCLRCNDAIALLIPAFRTECGHSGSSTVPRTRRMFGGSSA
jgi:hypothetical protein